MRYTCEVTVIEQVRAASEEDARDRLAKRYQLIDAPLLLDVTSDETQEGP